MQYRHKSSWGMKTYDVARWVEAPPQWPRKVNKRGQPKKEELFLFSKYVLQTVDTFIASEDQGMEPEHVPVCSSPDIKSPVEIYQRAVSSVGGVWEGRGLYASLYGYVCYDQVLAEAIKVWERMKDRDDREVGMTHDGEVQVKV